MTTEVSIFNMALAHIKSKSTVASIDEASTEAKKCKLFYAQARDETLEDFNWFFAKRTATLAVTGTPSPGWIYQYALPSDSAAIRKVMTTYRSDIPIPFELAHSELSDSIVILTDQEAAVVEYTKKIVNATLFSASFTAALSLKLASYIAMPLSGKTELRKEALALYNLAIARARANALNQGQKDEETDPSWIAGR